jgi:coenzyme F420 hydrogenase subunit beta
MNILTFDRDLEHPKAVGACKPECGTCYDLCSGRDVPLDRLDKMIFGRERSKNEQYLGIARSYVKGYAVDPVVREIGASGGCATALLLYMVEAGLAEGVFLAQMSAANPWISEGKLVSNRSDIMRASKSKYVVFPHNERLKDISKIDSTVGYVGLPCHIHSIRKMQLYGKPPEIADRIGPVLGLFCGWNSSFLSTARMVRELTKVKSLDEIVNLDYRGGRDHASVEIATIDGCTTLIPQDMRRWFACYDFAAELADISIGDPIDDKGGHPEGWSAMIVRTPLGQELLQGAEKAGYVKTEPIEANLFRRTPGLILKKYGAIHRILKRKDFGWPVPDFGYDITQLE